MFLMIVVATLPLFLVLPINDQLETLYYSNIFIGIAIILTGCMLYVADRMKPGRKTERNMTMLDALIIAPCTGNTMAKLSHGIADTPVTMAAKSHLRNGRPVVIAVSTNDGLTAAAENIGRLLARKHYYFVPLRQDDAKAKPTSLVAVFEKIPETVRLAAEGVQIQPILA